MISVNLRDKNHLIELVAPGKSLIMATIGSSLYYYNSMELLCCAYAACFSKYLMRWCLDEKINIQSFETLSVTMEDFQIVLVVQHPKTFTQEQLDSLKYTATHCDISKQLKNEPVIRFITNETPIETLLNEKKRSCCGG